jgi:DNA adenine methylase
VVVSQPVIKWSGSKRLQASRIVELFPSFETYYEPFVGGGSVLFEAKPKRAICGDICTPLIDFWKLLQESPRKLIANYTESWNKLQRDGYRYYYVVRDHFNKEPNPYDLLFLSRTCVNGLIRFNKDGKFNNSLHHTRRGIHPAKMAKIIHMWSQRIENVKFISGDYRETTKTVTKKDFLYLDPPYFNTRGRYYGRIDFKEFVEYLGWLNERGIRFALSFDGTRGNMKYIAAMPQELYQQHLLLESGNSTFRKVMNNKVEKVRESLYMNYCRRPQSQLSYSIRTGLSSLSNSSLKTVSPNSSEQTLTANGS